MRKGKQFTPELIRKWADNGRGQGTFEAYTPWHQVRRSDPASLGLSHAQIMPLISRQIHLLSNLELTAFYFVCMLIDLLVDLREQYRLQIEEHQFEIAKYDVRHLASFAPGTRQLADELKIKHPILKRIGDSEPWSLSTDLVLTLRGTDNRVFLLAISVKPEAKLKHKRTLELLRLERAYWEKQGVVFLVFSESTFDTRVARSLHESALWAINDTTICKEIIDACASIREDINRMSLTKTINVIQHRLNIDQGTAQAAFWRCVWSGKIPIDLTRSTWPSSPIIQIDQNSFIAQNPIASRRSA